MLPLRTSYDNTSIAVTKVMGRERELTRAFLALQSHYPFEHHFCRVGRGNEKGHVENHVDYSRRNLLVPVPTFASWAALNEYLGVACYVDPSSKQRSRPTSGPTSSTTRPSPPSNEAVPIDTAGRKNSPPSRSS
ncbi:MAG: hypothetical protein ACR2KC_00500 [Acidimicrobiales bacterium]